MIIEYDGIQHFKPIKYFGGKDTFILTKKCDDIKNKYCKTNSITMLRISYLKFNYIADIINEAITTYELMNISL